MSVGKRCAEELVFGRTIPPSSIFSTDDSTLSNKHLLDFILSHAHGDERPYLEISILGYKI